MKNILFIFLFLIFCGNGIACSISENEKANGSKCVDVGGYKLYSQVFGKKEPIVIFESGLGDDLTVWKKVMTEVSQFARVVIYDRAGLGRSDSKPGKRAITATDSLIDLKSLLKNENLKPPYILVGHSTGGLIMQLFAQRYPKEVAGMVLIDSASRDQNIHDSNPPKSSNYYPEAIAFDENRAQLKAAGKFPAIPLIILTATHHGVYANKEALWQKWQKGLKQLSPKAIQIFAWNSNHYIHKQQPQLVVDAIYTVLQSAKKE